MENKNQEHKGNVGEKEEKCRFKKIRMQTKIINHKKTRSHGMLLHISETSEEED